VSRINVILLYQDFETVYYCVYRTNILLIVYSLTEVTPIIAQSVMGLWKNLDTILLHCRF